MRRERLVASDAALAAVRAEWEDLAERCRASPFLRPGWVAAWWNSFGKGRLEIRTVRRADGSLAALLPLRRRFGALGSPTNWHSCEFGLVAESFTAARVLLASLFEARPRRISLAFLGPDHSALLERAAEDRGYAVIQRTQQRSPYVPLDGGWESYQRALGRKTRSKLKRKLRSLEAQGAVTFEVTTGERLDERLEHGFAVEASGWKGEHGTAIRSDPACLRFYTEVARWAAERGWLRLAFLRLDGRALAFDLGLEYDGIHYVIKTGYDATFKEQSPGRLLRYEMLARAFRAGLRSYELLGDEHPWKLQWTQATRPRTLVQGFRPSALGMLEWSLFAHARPLAKLVRDLARGRRRTAPPFEPETEALVPESIPQRTSGG